MTAIEEAMKKAGLHPRLVEFDKAIAKLLNSGGTIAEGQARLDIAATRMSGAAKNVVPSPGRLETATSRQPDDDGAAGQYEYASSAVVADLPAAPSPPARTSRGLSSISLTQPTIARGLLDTLKTSNGCVWGDVGWHELAGMDRDGCIARALKAEIAMPADQYTKIRQLISNKRFEELVDAARKQNSL